ncbi:vesicle-trafficking protein SEC22a [Exaiptasia diaphana]|uniref:Longin domain-containing protein n=1 Tax=Exaiptasia diaphana TaxID=2652724 RepID=A0A913Y0W2_EXADI|nr:vesicle-trafficking protein SEC22a [Exaiptasia diaphana]
MVLFAMISRVSDGMPLSASTDLDLHFEIKESKRQAKIVAKKANQYPIKCWTSSGSHNIYFVKAVGVCFITVCEAAYPTVLAYCFLDEIQREFMVVYQSQDVQRAKRPYSFIEFDSFIQKTKQRYNNTRSLTTRLNLSEMSEELQNHPPHQISQIDLTSSVDLGVDVKTYKTGGPPNKLQPITWVGMVICALLALCGLLNFIRCLPLLSSVGVNDESTENPAHTAICFFVAGILNCFQCYLLIFNNKGRFIFSCTASFFLIIFVIYLRNLRNIWQILFHVCVTLAALYQITRRQLQQKPPDYNV